MRSIIVIAGFLALGACADDAPKQKAAETVPAKLPAGQYEVTTTVTSLRSTDKTPVPTFAQVGNATTTQGCVAEDGLPAPELLAARGDMCQIENPYVRSGRMNLTLACDRKGQGKVMAQVDGRYTTDGFTGTLTAASMFPGSGDYELVQEITARKVGDRCTADPGRKSAAKA